MNAACELLSADDPREDEAFVAVAEPLAVVDLDRVVEGDGHAVASYVSAWRNARTVLLLQVTTSCPGLRLPPLTAESLDLEAVGAPFSSWVSGGLGTEGLALDLVASLRSLLAYSPRSSPLFPTKFVTAQVNPFTATDDEVRNYYRQVVAALSGRESLAAQIAYAFDLNGTEFGRLFGVSRQAASTWLANDVPVERRAKAAVVASIADLLTQHLKAGRVPGVARQPAAAYEGLTMLEMIAADRHEELLELTRASFDFGRAA